MSDWQPIETAPKDGTVIIVEGGLAYWRNPWAGGGCWYTITGADWPGLPIEWNVEVWQPFPERRNVTPPLSVFRGSWDEPGACSHAEG